MTLVQIAPIKINPSQMPHSSSMICRLLMGSLPSWHNKREGGLAALPFRVPNKKKMAESPVIFFFDFFAVPLQEKPALRPLGVAVLPEDGLAELASVLEDEIERTKTRFQKLIGSGEWPELPSEGR